MIIRRQLLAASIPACNTPDTRYFLHGVKVTRGKAESTNGHIAIRMTDPSPFPDTEFPYGPNGSGGSHLVPCDEALLPLASIQTALKNAPRRATIPVLTAIAVDRREGENPGLVLTTTNLDKRQAIDVRAPEQPFPDLDRVMPTQTIQTGLSVLLTVEVLEVLIAAVKASYGGKAPSARPIMFTLPLIEKEDVHGVPKIAGTYVERAVLATWKGDDGITGVAIAMPYRS